VTAEPEAVLLVGAGPGEPDLLTLRAEAALAAAPLVVTDGDLAPLVTIFAPGARAITAGDDPARTAAVLAEGRRDRAGERGPVVRLYRGDPWRHPQFAAEAEALAAAGVPHEAVPGPEAALATAARAGVAAHDRPRAVTLTLAPPQSLPAVGNPARTLITEAGDLAATAAHLAAEGEPDLPAAAIPTSGAGPHRATLAALAAVAPPTAGVLVLGAVAR
jgi:siroheme synthase